MARTRSEYRLTSITPARTSPALGMLTPDEHQRHQLAELMLDAYRDTIDDEGESLDDAVTAIDYYFESMARPHSYVVVDGPDLVAFAFVVVVDGLHYIDPVVCAPAHKRLGLGTAVVRRCLNSLAEAGISEVGAVITDGNVASERLFTGLGFERHGSWA